MGHCQNGATTFMSAVPVLTLNFGSPPCCRIACRKAFTNGLDFPLRTASSPPEKDSLAPSACCRRNALNSSTGKPTGSRKPNLRRAVSWIPSFSELNERIDGSSVSKTALPLLKGLHHAWIESQ